MIRLFDFIFRRRKEKLESQILCLANLKLAYSIREINFHIKEISNKNLRLDDIIKLTQKMIYIAKMEGQRAKIVIDAARNQIGIESEEIIYNSYKEDLVESYKKHKDLIEKIVSITNINVVNNLPI